MPVLAGLLISMLALSPAFANTAADEAPEVFRSGTVEISDPWAQAAIGEAHTALVFFEFRNRGASDAVVGASSPLAARVMLRHGTRPASRIELPPNGEGFELNRAGYHLALESLNLPLTMGKSFPVTLRFANGGEVTLRVTSRFHSPQLGRRIREAARRGDANALKALRPSSDQDERQ